MRTNRMKRLFVATILATFLPATTIACFGQFAMTRKVYGFNRNLSYDRWVRWFAFLISAVPLYGLAAAIDLVFANSIEFWGGQNPFAARTLKTLYAIQPDGGLVSATRIEAGVIEVRATEPNGAMRSLRIVSENESIAAFDERGQLVARVGERDGRPALLTNAIPPEAASAR